MKKLEKYHLAQSFLFGKKITLAYIKPYREVGMEGGQASIREKRRMLNGGICL